MRSLYIFVGLLMILGLVLGIIFTFVAIWSPSEFNAKMALSGGAGYFIFGYLVRRLK